MPFAIQKVIVNTGKPPLAGVLVGPFETDAEAQAYGAQAGLFNLGYEQWLVTELQPPSDLTRRPVSV